MFSVWQALAATVTDADNGYNNTNPALDLTNAQVVQTIIYGMKAWVSTTSDQSLPAVSTCSTCSLASESLHTTHPVNCWAQQLPSCLQIHNRHSLSCPCLLQSLANVDSRTIYAVAYATGNINTATTQAGNATDIQKAAYYTQATVRTHASAYGSPCKPNLFPESPAAGLLMCAAHRCCSLASVPGSWSKGACLRLPRH